MPARDLDAVFRKLAKRHLIPKRDSVVDLTFRLRSNLEEVKAQAAQACCGPSAENSTFLRSLARGRALGKTYLW